MADRGRPLPMYRRKDIKELIGFGHSLRAVAKILGLHFNTVKKYAGKSAA